MAQVTHQTIRLSRGRHSSPESGACVMELASMLAHEEFTDHPVSVCPVIAAFLRSYNDAIDDRRRQALYPYAAKVVGSRATREIQRKRAQRVSEWMWALRPPRRFLRWVPRHPWPVTPSPTQVGALAERILRKGGKGMHADALRLVDELLEIGKSGRESSEAERMLGLRQTIETATEPR